MLIDKEFIKKFKKIYKKKEGKNLSNKRVTKLATDLLLAFDTVYKPIPLRHKKEFEKIKKEIEKNEH